MNDARAMTSKLQSLGFRVIKKENLRQREIGSTLRELRGAIKPGDEVLFFYAGHGLQVKGVNYLPTVDSDIQSKDDVPLQSMSLDQLLGVLDESKAGVKLLFLDACRNNPYSRSFRSASGSDLGRIGNASSGTLIHYATRPGSVADDGKKGGNGLYTANLLEQIGHRGLTIETMHKRVAAGVRASSRSKQEPWTEGQLEGEYYFVAGIPTSVSSVRLQSVEEIEQQAWNAAEQSATAAALNAYLAEYPKGRFASAAKVRLAAIEPISSTQTLVLPQAGQLFEGYETLNDFVLGKASLVRDLKSGLVWQRCSVGQNWNGNTCAGTAQIFTYDQAQKLSLSGWRVPIARELAGLIYCSSGQVKKRTDPDGGGDITDSCVGRYQQPAVHTGIFPATPEYRYWSSSPYAGSIFDAWYVFFQSGYVHADSRHRGGHIRLVQVSQ